MPVVLRVGGFVFSFYSNDHEPAHVHCANGDGVATIQIATAETVSRMGAMRDKDARRAEALVAEHRDLLQEAWNVYAERRRRVWP
jgi:hypothetical protein